MSKGNTADPCIYYQPTSEFVSKKLVNYIKKDSDNLGYDYILHTQDMDYSVAIKNIKVISTKVIDKSHQIVNLSLKLIDDLPPRIYYIYTVLENNKWKIDKVEVKE